MTATRYEDGPGDSPGFLLWRATMRWQRLMTATLAPLGLTHVQFVLLACVDWLTSAGEQPSQARVAAQASIDVKMTSEVLRRLEGKGLIERTPHPTDTRANVIRLTPLGAAKAHESVRAVEAADATHFAVFDAEQPQLLAILRVLATSEEIR